jgi:CRISPR-associated protein Cas2
MIRTLLITYDIRDAKRVQRVYKTMRSYGEHIQYSVFLCEFTPELEHTVRIALNKIIDPYQDQVLFIPIRGRIFIEALGIPFREPDVDCILVMDSAEDSDDIVQKED